jgi:hypothetical protein
MLYPISPGSLVKNFSEHNFESVHGGTWSQLREKTLTGPFYA